MGAPAYIQLSISDPSFTKQCPAEDGTRHCRNKRRCDLAKPPPGSKEEVAWIIQVFMSKFESLSPEQQIQFALRLAESSICTKHYQAGRAEEVAGKILKEMRARIVLATPVPFKKEHEACEGGLPSPITVQKRTVTFEHGLPSPAPSERAETPHAPRQQRHQETPNTNNVVGSPDSYKTAFSQPTSASSYQTAFPGPGFPAGPVVSNRFPIAKELSLYPPVPTDPITVAALPFLNNNNNSDQTRIRELEAENQQLKTKLRSLEAENQQLKEQVADQTRRAETMELKLRAEKLFVEKSKRVCDRLKARTQTFWDDVKKIEDEEGFDVNGLQDED